MTATVRRSRRLRFERFASGYLRATRATRVSTRRPNPVSRVPCWRRRPRFCYARWRPRSRTPRTPRTPRFRSRARARRYDSRRIYARTPRETPSPRFSSTPRALERDRTEWPPKARRRFERSWNSRRGTRTRSARDGRPQSRSSVASTRYDREAIRTRAKTPETLRRFARRFEPRTTTRSKVTIRIPKTSPFRIPKTSPFRVPKTSPFRFRRRRRRGDDRARGAERRRETFGRVVVERRGNRRDERGVLGVDATRHRRSHRVRRRARARRARTSLGRRRRVLRRKRGDARARLADRTRRETD